MRALVCLLVIAILAPAGCLETLHELKPTQDPLDRIPGIGDASFDDALLTMQLTGCQETHMMFPANQKALLEATPSTLQPRLPSDEDPQLVLTDTRCQNLTVPGTTAHDVHLLSLSTPLESQTTAIHRDDALLAMYASNATITHTLQDAGLPVNNLEQVRTGTETNYRIAEQRTLTVETQDHPFQVHLTSVSLETDLPLDTASALARHQWIQTDNQTFTLEPALNVTEIGGATVTLETRPGTQLSTLLGTRTANGHGLHAVYDARLGLIPQN